MQALLKFQSVIVSSLAKKSLVCRVEYSPVVFQLLKVLRRSGYIYGFQFNGLGFYVYLRYLGGTPALSNMKLVSKSGARVYVRSTEIRRYGKKFPHVVHVVSTTNGLKTFPTISTSSRKNLPVGEYLFRLW